MAPALAAAGFHRLPALVGTWERGSGSLTNLLRAGRTQARALSARKECGPPPKCSRVGSRETPDSAAARPAGAGREGTESPAPGASVRLPRGLAKDTACEVLPGFGPASRRLQSRGAAREPASLQRAPRLASWSSHLWESLALGLSLLGRAARSPQAAVALPVLGDREIHQGSKGATRPLRLLSSLARTVLNTSGGCFPFTARTPQ